MRCHITQKCCQACAPSVTRSPPLNSGWMPSLVSQLLISGPPPCTRTGLMPTVHSSTRSVITPACKRRRCMRWNNWNTMSWKRHEGARGNATAVQLPHVECSMTANYQGRTPAHSAVQACVQAEVQDTHSVADWRGKCCCCMPWLSTLL